MPRLTLPFVLACSLLSAACGSKDEEPALQPLATGDSTAAPASPPEQPSTPAATPGGGESVSVDQLAGSPPPGAEPAAGADAPERSPGCGQPALPNGLQTLSVGGIERTFLLDVPNGYDPSQAYPLVFGFHGATTSGEFFRSNRYGNLLSAMGAEAIVVHANALGDPTAWNNQADVPFFDAMLESLEQTLCVDEARVFATGHSSGGFFTNTLGCQRGNVLRAIAPVSGGGPFGGANCTGDVAVWLAHGENDMTVPFSTGVASRDGWVRRNGCSMTTAAATPAECVDYTGCGEGVPVSWCVHQNGHNWPGFAPQAMWDFFRSL